MRYASIRKMDISNGEGIGVSLFVQGCHFHCRNCFNSELWDFDGGKEWNDETAGKFMELATRPYVKRISILGGEPLADGNLMDVSDLLSAASMENKAIWLYTGYTWEEIYKDDSQIYRAIAVSYADVLVDGRYIDELKDPRLKWHGSSNQRVIDVKRSLETLGKEIILYEQG